MKRALPLWFGLVACGGPSSFDDAAPIEADAAGIDGSAEVDAAVPDAGTAPDADVTCVASGVGVFGVGGPDGAWVVSLTVGFATDATDGIYGVPSNDGAPLALEDIADVAGDGTVALGEGGVWHLDGPAALGDPMAAAYVGDAPGLTSLAYASNVGLFGASGLTIHRITLAPFSVDTVGTVSATGCTGVADFGVAQSDTSAVFSIVLDCAGGDRHAVAIDTPGVGFMTSSVSDTAGPDITAANGLGWATSTTTLYRVQAGAFTEIRPLSPCIGDVRGMD